MRSEQGKHLPNSMRKTERLWEIAALVVLVLGILGILRLYVGEVHWRRELPLARIVSLFAALVAFLAIMIRLEVDRNARIQEHERQRKSVAKALFYEIDSIRVVLEAQLGEIDKGERPTRIISPNLPVFEGNTRILGTFTPDLVEKICRFYNSVKDHAINSHRALDEVNRAKERARTASLGDPRLLESSAAELRYLTNLRALVAEAQRLGKDACNALQEFADIPPEITIPNRSLPGSE